MRWIALLLVCALAVPAFAQPVDFDAPTTPPSKTLERAIKLYDKKDFYSSTIELQKVLDGESGDDTKNKQRAQFFMGKTLYQMGFYGASLSVFAAIANDPQHTYFAAVGKWIVSILRVAPSPSARAPLAAYANTQIPNDPMYANLRDELQYQIGSALVERDAPSAQAIDLLSQSKDPRAELDLARVQLRTKDFANGIARAKSLARTPAWTGEAARLVAAWAHVHGYDARAALAELPGPYARYQASRAQLDGARELPGLAAVPVDAFDAVIIPSACRGNWPDDIKPLARRTIDEAKPLIDKIVATADDADVFDMIRHLQRQPGPGSDVVLAAIFFDPKTIERFAWLAEIDVELGNLQKTDKAFQVTQAAANILQELTVLQAVEAGAIGALARQRVTQVREGITALESALAQASPAFALSAGPNGKLVMTGELCGAGGGGAVASGTPSTMASRPANGCAGCASGGGSTWPIALVVAMLVGRARRDRSRDARARRG